MNYQNCPQNRTLIVTVTAGSFRIICAIGSGVQGISVNTASFAHCRFAVFRPFFAHFRDYIFMHWVQWGIWLLVTLYKNDVFVTLTNHFQQNMAPCFGCHFPKVFFFTLMLVLKNELILPEKLKYQICKLGSISHQTNIQNLHVNHIVINCLRILKHDTLQEVLSAHVQNI